MHPAAAWNLRIVRRPCCSHFSVVAFHSRASLQRHVMGSAKPADVEGTPIVTAFPSRYRFVR